MSLLATEGEFKMSRQTIDNLTSARLMPPFRLGKKKKTTVLDANGKEVVVCTGRGGDIRASAICIALNLAFKDWQDGHGRLMLGRHDSPNYQGMAHASKYLVYMFNKIYDNKGNIINPIPKGKTIAIRTYDRDDDNGGFVFNTNSEELGIQKITARAWILQEELDSLIRQRHRYHSAKYNP